MASTPEQNRTPEEIEALCKTDLDFFASFCMPEVTESRWPPFYHQVWWLLIKQIHQLKIQIDKEYVGERINELFRFALGLPRGHAKTTFIKLLVAYCIIYGLIDFVLVVCASEPRAQDLMSDLADILSSDNVSKIYANWNMGLGKDTKELKTCRFGGRDVILAAIGSGTSVRGLNLKNKRPDLILFDDAQSKDNDDSPTERVRLLKWVVGTALKLRNPKRCAAIYIGNLYSETCILWMFHQSKYWSSLITGAILADGTALWSAIRSISSLKEEFEHDASVGEADTWFAEIQNDPRGAKRSLLPHGTVPEPPEGMNREDVIGAFITIDPAGNKKNSDDNVIAVHEVYPNWIIDVPAMTAEILDPESVIIKTIQYAIDYRVSVIFVEAVAYQQTLAFWMQKYLKSYGLEHSIEIVETHPGKASKLSRIRTWIGSLLDFKYILTSAAVRYKVLYQALDFNIEKTTNRDDILDCLAMGEMVKNKYPYKVKLNLVPGELEVLAHVQRNNTPIDRCTRRSI